MQRSREIAFDFKAERISYKLTQVEVAQILFVDQSQISRWEHNGNMPKVYQELWKVWKVSREANDRLQCS